MTDENRDLDDDALITLAEPNSYDKLMEVIRLFLLSYFL